MKKISFRFSNSRVDYYLAYGISHLKQIVDPNQAVIITDENVFTAHTKRFRNWNTIVLKPGEEYKVQATVDSIIEQLIEFGADRKTTLIGVGGGVVTDMTGYAASVYMRGIAFGFIPTTVLAMVDASIGGKNGIDVGVYKNMVGIIRQPAFILHDMAFLKSLPEAEWQNGFAEIIKHACIRDLGMFKELQSRSLAFYRRRQKSICELIQRNVLLKSKVVQKDEFEKGDRKLLNFGHTLGHALENQYELSHGQAISIGMTYACQISAWVRGFKQSEQVINLLDQYGLPTYASFDKEKAFQVLLKDKKKVSSEISYVMLDRIGKGVIQQISITQLKQLVDQF